MKNSVNRTLDSPCLFKVKFSTLNVSLNSWKSALTNFIRMQISFCKMCILHTDANYVRWPHKLEQPIYGSVQNWYKVFLIVINHLSFTNQNPSFIRWYKSCYLEFISQNENENPNEIMRSSNSLHVATMETVQLQR